ncbi:MAG TPA: hypothetical protein VFE05_04345 [Longimicrobiaceae bacterium]|jgi:hypothetical protein|nr:hypothetical protein [Longimicrobiaceae bacterium]
MHRHPHRGGRSPGLLPRRAAGLLALALPLAACNLDKTLEVKDPFTVTPGVARDTLNLINAYAGAKARLATALGGVQNANQGLIVTTGLLADEFVSSDNFDDRREIDRRAIHDVNNSNLFSFTLLQQARAEANNAADLYASTSRSGSAEHAELLNVAGYAELMLAENYCSGVPFSTIPVSGPIQFGAPLTTAEVLDSALAKFDASLALTGSAAQKTLSHLGRARVLLDRGQFAAAAAEAALVPSGFRYVVDYNATTQGTYNAVEQLVNEEERFSAADLEGTVHRGLPYRTAGDSRTPQAASASPSALGGPHFKQLKYAGRGSPVVLGSGYEARYIEAEAALQANPADVAGFVGKLNAARAALSPTLPALTAADAGATTASKVDLLFRERAFSLWLTATRLSDLRRLIRQYGRTQDQVFPTGFTANGENYGTDVNLPVPFEESGNPNAQTGCIDRNA